MQRKYFVILVLVIALVGLGGIFLYAAQSGGFGGLGRAAQEDQPGLYAINHFIDGDTIAVNMNGHTEKVRFIGVDTPETHKPNTPVQCYGPQAAAFTKQTIGSRRVRLVSDPLSTDRDRYNRLLRYIYLPDGTNVEETLIRDGYGFYYPYFPFSKSAQFAADEQTAMSAHRGLWAHCHPTPTDSGGYTSNPQT
jgi:micrococcal nuclease